jgi:AraC-like DNA-binding protein
VSKGDPRETAQRARRAEMPERIERIKQEPVVQTWRSADYDSIELHRGSSITMDYARHWHDELYLCAVVDGGGDLDCQGSSYSTPPGTLVLLPSGEVHANRKRECSFRCMFIEFPALQKAVEQFNEQAVPTLHFRPELIHNSQMMRSFLRLHRALESRGSKLFRDSAAMRLFQRLVSRHSAASIAPTRAGNEDFAVSRTKKYLEEHYAEQISLHDLARLTRLSPYYLHRSFCKKVGMPPHAYQVQVRVSRARSFLRRGRSISDAACAAGFVDQSHFTRHFKRFTGVTPGRYLRLEQECTRRSHPHSLTSSS